MNEESNLTPQSENESPHWDRSTKIIVTVTALALVVWVTYRFQALIGYLVAAAMLAYILNPLIVFLDVRTGLKRSTGILIVYLLLAAAVIGALVALGFAAVEQAVALIQQLPSIIQNITALIEELTTRTDPIILGPIAIDPATVNWNLITEQLVGLVQPLVGRSGLILRDLATAIIRLLGTLIFVFMVSVYFANEIPQLGNYVSRLANQPGYSKDAERLMREFGRIWSAYLRGQVILGLSIGIVVWLGLTLLGVQNALALGILSGLLEFIPVLGPVIGGAAAIIVAFFQPTNYLGLPPLYYAGVVLLFMIIVQQVENVVFVPRIVGEALDLHPIVVIVGVFIGASLAGILGAILAAPVVATIKLLGTYAWRKMFDLPPFPRPELEDQPASSSILKRARELLAHLVDWFERWRRQRRPM